MQNKRIRQRRKTDPGMQDKIFFCEVNKKIHCHRLVSRGTCFSEMSNSFLAVEHLEEVHDDIVSKAFDGTYLIRKLKQRNICLRILYGMKKCGQVTYAKQLSAALEQEGVELTL